MAGTLAWVKQFHPSVKVIGVEPAGAASMQAALAAGAPQTLSEIDNFADGTAVARAGDIPFKIVRDLLDEIVSVPEGAICTEMLELYQVEGIIAEPAGALASAALDYIDDLPPGPVACIVTGGNNDVMRYDDIVERSMIHEGLRLLPRDVHKTGALRGFRRRASWRRDIISSSTRRRQSRNRPRARRIEIDDPSHLAGLLERMSASDLEIEKLEPNSPAFGFVL